MSTSVGQATAPRPEWCVHELFAERAAAAPGSVALECGERRLSYGELDALSNQVAHLLRESGVGPGTAVAVCAVRGPGAVVALLAVLKAGGHYLPLDPEYPAERLAFMLADSAAGLVLVQPEFADHPGLAGRPAVLLEEGWPAAVGRPRSAPGAAVTAADLAYVMYTSGSTGRPKAVGVTHRNVYQLVREGRFADLGAGEVFLHLASLAFDAATFELWGALCNGARLAILPAGIPSAAAVEAAVREHGVTLVLLTAGLFQHVVRTRPLAFAPVRRVLVGGDVLPTAESRALLAQGVELSNVYGPTECTVFCCVRRGVTEAETRAGAPIGPPVPGATAAVLDERGEPVAVGERGELVVGGPVVGLGYLGRPALTAERFVPDPLAAEPGARRYRTGDLVRQEADGTLHFVGRADQQVKILGHRVEPGEIEAALGNHPEVRAVVVTVHRTAAGDKQLVAHVAVTEALGTPVGPPLREYLRGRLPEYLVPTAWVRLDELPLSPNGKIDRAALPAPAPGADGTGPAPGNALEQAVAEVWSELLGIAGIAAGDDFFELGGHSLLATQVVALLRERFPVELPVSAVFEHPTVARLAAELTRVLTDHVAQLSDAEVESMLTQVSEG
ncbi:amino acid adenylation domain-containing protein [Kitasatospora sp. NPDC052896]|uniref:amino acid adenylation domain-containing protein n=1 Tax=Kitasatospora sp. NPDC052896 TaxID=3364061 RepID=UPI0037C9840C